MANNNYEVFDDGAFYWFGLTMMFFMLFMPTLRRLRTFFSPEDEVTPVVDRKKNILPYDETRVSLPCACGSCASQREHLKRERSKAAFKKRYSLRNFIFVVLWIFFLTALSKVGEYQNKEVLSFDPYEILGVERGAKLAEIKRAYRKKSLQFHPDKNPGSQEHANRFVLIAKAHTTLTDDTARENWEKYGNPDGYQGTSTVIGLPSFLVKEENHLWVLVGYLLLVIVTPIALGFHFWRKLSSTHESGIKTTTLQRYMEAVINTQNPKMLVETMCVAGEFEPVAALVSKPEQYTALALLHEAVKPEMKAVVNQPFVLASNILLTAHMLRLSIPEPLRPALEHVLRSAFEVSGMMTEIALAKRCTFTPPAVVKLLQSITQGIMPGESPLLQIPHISEDELYYLVFKNKKKVKTVREFLAMSDEDRRNVFREHTDEQLAEMVRVARLVPEIDVTTRIENKFADDDDDLPAFDDDAAHAKSSGFSAKAIEERRREAAASSREDMAEIYEGDVLAIYVNISRRTTGENLDSEAAAGDDKNNNGKDGGKAAATTDKDGAIVEDSGEVAAHKVSAQHRAKDTAKQGSFFSSKDKATERSPIAAHAPMLPFLKQEIYHVFLCLPDGQVLARTTVASPLSPTDEAVLHVQAPPKGKQDLLVMVMCDSHPGLDHVVKITLKVTKSKESYVKEAEARMERARKDRVEARKRRLKERKRIMARGAESDSEDEGGKDDDSVSSVDTEDAMDYSTDEEEEEHLDMLLDSHANRGEEEAGSGQWAETAGYFGAAAVVGVAIVSWLQGQGYLDPILTRFGFEPTATAATADGAGAGSGSGSGSGFGSGSGSGSGFAEGSFAEGFAEGSASFGEGSGAGSE